MQFTALFGAVALALLAVHIPGAYADVIAFDGSQCDGGEGQNKPCDTSCIGSSDRHSIQVLAGGPHCLEFFQDGDCQTNVGTVVNPGGGACTNINTGTNVQSFKCNPNAVCN